MTQSPEPSFRLTPQLVFGLVIVAAGLLMTASNLHWIEARSLWRYFPLGFVAVGIAKILQPDGHSGKMFGWLLLIVGIWLSANTLLSFSFSIGRWWPLLLILLGAVMIIRARGEEPEPTTVSAETLNAGTDWNRTGGDQTMTEFAFWSGKQRRSASPAFKKAELTAIMGGIEVDLRAAGTAGEAVIDCFAFWGGIEITVPPDWAVSNKVVAIMGGAEDSTSGTQDARHRLTVRGFAIMGGIEIKTKGRNS